MHMAIDIDGTLGSYPGVLGHLAEMYLLLGHKVTLLTGGLVERVTEEAFAASVQARLKQVAGFYKGLTPSWLSKVTIHPVLAQTFAECPPLKGEFCKNESVHLFIDDSPDYCEAVRRLSPATLVLQVK